MSKVEHISNYKNVEDFTPNYDIDKNGDPIKLSAIEPNEPSAFDESFNEDYKTFFLPPDRIIKDAEFWSFIDTERKTGIFDAGNFSVITGQQKSRKTFFLSIIASSWIKANEKIVNVISNPPENKNVCLYFDTEQSEKDAQRVQKRILKLANLETSEKFHYFNMRGADIEKIIYFIFKAIEQIKNVGFVIIDGVADLLESINDEVGTKQLIKRIEKTTLEKNIHISFVLHQNKGSEFLSGWIGSTGVRKASCVIKLSKCKDLPNKRSVVECMDLRSSEAFEKWSFEISENGLPFAVENYKKLSNQPYQIIFNKEQIATILKTSHKANIKKMDFVQSVSLNSKRVAKENNIQIDFTARRDADFIQFLLIENVIIERSVKTTKFIDVNDKHLFFNAFKQAEMIM